MAESTGNKSRRTLDAFADELDSMLNVDAGAEQQVGLIDDDDAIDRLLVGDVFEDNEPETDHDELSDIDKLIAENSQPEHKEAPEIDEFGDDIDDIIAGIQINPKRDDAVDADDIGGFTESDEEDIGIDNGALEAVGEIDEFTDNVQVLPEFEPEVNEIQSHDELEKMTEIDEFAEAPEMFASDNADFLLADFDISADDEPVKSVAPVIDDAADRFVEPEPVAQQAGLIDDFADDEFPAAIDADETLIADRSEVADEPDELDQFLEPELPDEPVVSVAPPAPPLPLPEKSAPAIDYSAELAVLSTQIAELKKQQKQVRQEIQLKVDKEALTGCIENIDSLQTEQKKAKRNLDAVINKKPVGLYVANGVAATAIVIASALGIEAFITKSQVGELVEIIGKLQQQVTTAPTADAADKEMLRKQLDELAVAQSVASNQIAELSKTLHSGPSTATTSTAMATERPSGDLGKQLSDLSNQDMQMGAAIEALQNKVSALEKGRVASASPVKPVPKKPVVVEENWVVNLVAFKQDWYAKRKAEEFAGKGVPAKVSKSEAKGESWYRLTVDGFKSQYEAAAYAAKVKKTLNLDSVSVAKSKN